tara:strand:+ start:24 stop:1073 length:1050 start_codon:yes stop_codon:yes gene_type:complete
MAFKSLKNHISNLATPFLANSLNNFMNKSGAQDAGKMAAQLKRKSPFNIPNSPTEKLIENPLSFTPVQYPLDLGNEQLGHYIVFESGFLNYSPQTDGLLLSAKNKKKKIKGNSGRENAIVSKLPDKSIMSSAIAIYMPPSIKVSYTQNYDAAETGIAGAAEAIIDRASGQQSAEQIKTFLTGGAGVATNQLKKLVGEAVDLIGVGDPVRFVQKRSGVALNPRQEQFYDSPDFREFSYSFDFWPRNAKEAEAVDEIIKIFKYNSAPGLNAGTQGAFFDIPNYFKISYMFNNQVNPHLNLISACYCKGVEVDYAPDGQPSFFPDGRPVHTTLTVNFVEDRILTKDDILEGA